VSDAKQKHLIVSGAFAAGVLAVLIVGYMMVISPKRSKAADLQREAVATQSELTLAQVVARKPAGTSSAGAPDLFRLSKAMPDRVDTASAILDLVAVGKATDVALEGLTPSEPVAATAGGYELVPISATVVGTYPQLTNFLAHIRQLVVVRNGRINARGRLFGVDSIQFAPEEAGSSVLKATLKLDTYVYSGVVAAPPTTTTPEPTSDLSAAGASG
jgi:Tfp pilus assembly protein PilO